MSLAQSFAGTINPMPTAPIVNAMPGPDLDDPTKFVLIPAVPVVKTHEADHDKAGKVIRQAVTADRMRLLVENGNRRARAGDYGIVTIGHTNDDPDEHGQPEYVGFAKNYRVADRFGEKVILADLFISRSKHAKAATFPRRSAEVWGGTTPSDHFIDIISLLRRTPRFDLGAWDQDEVARYHRTGGLSDSATLARYACDLPEDGAIAPDPAALDRGLKALGLGGLARYAKASEGQGELFGDDCGTGAGGFKPGNSCAGKGEPRGGKADDGVPEGFRRDESGRASRLIGDHLVRWEEWEDADDGSGAWIVYDGDMEYLESHDDAEDAVAAAQALEDEAESGRRAEAADDAREQLTEAYSTLEAVAEDCDDADAIGRTLEAVHGVTGSLQSDCPDRNTRQSALAFVLDRNAATNCPGGEKGKFGRGNDCHKTRARERAEREVKRTAGGNPARSAEFAKRIAQAERTGDDDRLTDAGRGRKAAEKKDARRRAMEAVTGKAADVEGRPGEAPPEKPEQTYAYGSERLTKDKLNARLKRDGLDDDAIARFWETKQRQRVQFPIRDRQDGYRAAVEAAQAKRAEPWADDEAPPTEEELARDAAEAEAMRAEKGIRPGKTSDSLDRPADRTIKLKRTPKTPAREAARAAQLDALDRESHYNNAVNSDTSPEYRNHLQKQATRAKMLQESQFQAAGMRPPGRRSLDASRADIGDGLDEAAKSSGFDGTAEPAAPTPDEKRAARLARRDERKARSSVPEAARQQIGELVKRRQAEQAEAAKPGPRPSYTPEEVQRLNEVESAEFMSPDERAESNAIRTRAMERARGGSAETPKPSAFEQARAEADRKAPGTLEMPKSQADPDAFALKGGPTVGGGGSGRTVQGSMFTGGSALDAETQRPRRADLPGQAKMFGGGEETPRKPASSAAWDSVPKEGREAFEQNAVAPLKERLEKLDSIAKNPKLGARYAWEAAKNLGIPSTDAFIDRWKAFAAKQGLDAESLVAAHPELADIKQRLAAHRSWGDEPEFKPRYTARNARRSALDAVLDRNCKGKPCDDDPTVMVGFWLPGDVAESLALPGGEAKDQLHLTLCHLGRRSKVGTDGVARIEGAIRDLAHQLGPITATLGGPGRFPASGSSDGKDVVVATVDAPGLADFRERVASHLRNTGVEPSRDHDFNPHVTLRYIAPGRRLPIQRIAPTEVTFGEIVVAIGDERRAYPLRKDGPMPGSDHPMPAIGPPLPFVARYSRRLALDAVLARYDFAPRHRAKIKPTPDADGSAPTNCPGGEKGKFGSPNDCWKSRGRKRAEREVGRTADGNAPRAAEFAKRLTQAKAKGDANRLTDAGRSREAAVKRAALKATRAKRAKQDEAPKPSPKPATKPKPPGRVKLSEAHTTEGSALWHLSKSIGQIRTKAGVGRHAGGEYDGLEYLPRELQAQVGTSDPGAMTPDEAVDALIARGALPEGSSTSDMFEALIRDYEDYREARDQAKRDEAFDRHARSARPSKDAVEIDTDNLRPGDTFEFGPAGREEEFEVTDDYHPEGIVAKDGPRYGTQVIDPRKLAVLKVKRTDAASEIASREAPDYAYAGVDGFDDGDEWTPF